MLPSGPTTGLLTVSPNWSSTRLQSSARFPSAKSCVAGVSAPSPSAIGGAAAATPWGKCSAPSAGASRALPDG